MTKVYRWWKRDADDRLRSARGRLAPQIEVDGCRALDHGHLLPIDAAAGHCGLTVAQVRDLVKHPRHDCPFPEPMRVGGVGNRAAVLLWPRSVLDEWLRARGGDG